MRSLQDEGIEVTVDGVDSVTVAPPSGRPTTFRLVVRGRAPRPSEVTKAPRGRWMLYSKHIPARSAAALAGAGWSWASDTGFDLRGHGWSHRVVKGFADPVETAHARPGRIPSATWSVIRDLLADDRRYRQADLAASAGVTQGRVSQILKQLSAAGLVDRTTGGWAPPSRRALADWFCDNYTGAGGIETWWYSLDPVMEQADAVGSLDDAVVSGDAGADRLTAWRAPTRLVLYTPRLVDVASFGFVNAQGAGDATMLLVAKPADTSIFRGRATADPIQVAFDLHRLGGDDRAEAADRLLTAAYPS